MYRFESINEEYIDQLILWKYEEEYACYDIEDRISSISKLFEESDYDFFVGFNESEEMVGYMECFFKEDILEVGHGLNPIFIGKGLSYDFILDSIEYAVEKYDYSGEVIRILIEPFNKRALKVYQRIGFTIIEETLQYIKLELDM